MADVFLSYRRDDARSATGRLADRLQAAFGRERVFRDIDGIEPGADFEAALQRAIGGASVLLAVVGPRWLDALDAAGRRRLDDPADMVRREIESAFAAGVPVIPVLVEGARMPAADALPPSLAAFARCQAVPLDDARWHDDSARLVALLCERHGIDAAAGASAARPRLAALPLELLELVARPRRVIRRLAGQGGADELARAALLLVACLAAGNLLLGAALEVDLAAWVFNGTLLGVLWSAALAATTALGWRIAGVRAGWRRVGAGAACVIGGAWLYASAGLLVVVLGVAASDASAFTSMLALLRQGPSAHGELEAFIASRVRGPALAAIVIASALWLAGLAWLLAAWNALRLALSARPLAALGAAAVVVALLGGLVEAARWAAGG
ncbi:MAG TPA: toll/interleukin-1 receptor domain-containing protein [Albitalea sp.]